MYVGKVHCKHVQSERAKADTADFLNLTETALSKDTSLLKFSWNSDQYFNYLLREVANRRTNKQMPSKT